MHSLKFLITHLHNILILLKIYLRIIHIFKKLSINTKLLFDDFIHLTVPILNTVFNILRD